MTFLRLFIACLLLSCACGATAAEVWVVSDEGDAYHRNFAEALVARSPRGAELSLRPIDAAVPAGTAAPQLLITLGGTAAALRTAWNGPVVHVFLTAAQFEALYPKGAPPGHSALFLDQPLGRYVALVRAALPQASHLIVPVAVPGQPALEGLRESARDQGLALQEAAVTSPQDLDRLLEQADPQRGAMLFLPDPALRSNAMMKVAIVGAYKYRIPLVAYSEGLATAGALMAVHTTVPLLVDEVTGIVERFVASGKLPPPSYPSRFDLAINYQLAKSLNLRLPSQESLIRQIKGARP